MSDFKISKYESFIDLSNITVSYLLNTAIDILIIHTCCYAK